MRTLLILLAGCSSVGGGIGTVVYTEAGTGNVRTVDVASGDGRLIDDGMFVDVAIASDRGHVAYSGFDDVIKVADFAGTITPLDLAGGSGGSATWGPNSSLWFSIGEAFGCGTVFVPTIGAIPRSLSAYNPEITDDGTTLVYDQLAQPCGPGESGDLVVENADGSNHRVLVSDVEIDSLLIFTPDQQHVVNSSASRLQMISLADGSVTDLGPGGGFCPIGNSRSLFSPDGSELLVFDNGVLSAVNLSTGTRRMIVEAPASTYACPAAFVDADRVVYGLTMDTTPPGSEIMSHAQSIHVTDGTDDITLMPTTNGDCLPVGIDSGAGFVAVVCNKVAIVSLDGTSLGTVDADGVLGLSEDSRGVVTLTGDGEIDFLSTGGEVRRLATASSPSSESAAYAP